MKKSMVPAGKMRSGRYKAAVALAAAAALPLTAAMPTASAATKPITIGVVEQQLSNPFFLTIMNAEKAEAAKYGAKIYTAAAQTAGDTTTQLNAIQSDINRKVTGIVIDPTGNASALVPVIRQARSKGIIVIAVNTQTAPATAVNSTIETDNFKAGTLIGRWALSKVPKASAHVALLDYNLTDRTSDQRHLGFLKGFGIKANSPQVVAETQTDASVSGGQTAMENMLSAHSNINVVYGINEPMAEGAYAAVAARHMQKKVTVVGIDGSCAGIKSLKQGAMGADVMQFPIKMGQMAVSDIVSYARNHKTAHGIVNSGTVLITDHPVKGIPSQSAAWGMQHCWGPK